jgi:hypothetical protein
MRISRMLVTCLFTAALALGAIGCDTIAEKIQKKVIEKAVEKSIEANSGGEAKLDLSGKSVSGTFKKGKQVTALGEGASVPDDFPKQIPIYPGAKLNVSHADRTGAPQFGLGFSVAAPPEKVAAYYKNELKGFKLEQELSQEGGHALSFADKAQAKLSVQITIAKGDEDNESNVMLHAETLR